MLKYLLLGAIVLGLVVSVPDAAVAKDKGKPEHAQGKAKVKAKGDGGGSAVNPGKGNNGNAKGPKAVPPGQIKRYTRGAKLPADVNWDDIGDLSNWKLPPPGKGNKYIKVDNEILEIAEDTQTVIDAVGIVSDLMK